MMAFEYALNSKAPASDAIPPAKPLSATIVPAWIFRRGRHAAIVASTTISRVSSKSVARENRSFLRSCLSSFDDASIGSKR